MKKLLLLLFLFYSITGFCQQENKMGKGKTNMKLLAGDSVMVKLEKMKDSVKASQIQEEVARNADEIIHLQKEQKARQKKAALLRISIGVGLLAVLIIGLRRKRRKQD